MPGLHLHTSNRLEHLADALAEVLARPTGSPLTPETVVVQSKGMERWLSLQLAARRGIWANYRFPFPTALIRELLGSVLEGVEENPLLVPEILAWRLYELLPALLERTEFAPLRAYLAGHATDPVRLWQLGGRIADSLDQYLVYRHDLIRTWEQGGHAHLGPHEAWQAALWRLLAPPASLPHRVRLVEAFAARIAQGPLLAGCALPERLSLFGVNTLPPLHLEVLASVAPFTEVHLFLLNPCRGYWFELKTPAEEAQTLRHAGAHGVATDELWLASGHPLLASLGRSGRDLFRRLFDYELTSHEYFTSVANHTLLQCVQSDILDGECWPPAQRHPLTAYDRSLTFHACYGRLREVEALYDLLLKAFRELDGLQPREVLVMAPDIEVYAPLIEAVFGAEAEGKRLIPYAISDRGTGAGSAAQQAFLRLCALPEGRRGAAELLDLLELAPVARRFGLTGDDAAIVRDWVAALHIHWGLDQGDRVASGAPAEERFTWRAGLDRLLLGLALPPDEKLFGGLLPADDAVASPALLGRLCDFVALLAAWCDDSREARSVPAWAERLQRLLEELLDPGDNALDLLLLQRACTTLAAEAHQAGFLQPVDFSVVRLRLEALLAERSSQGFLSGPVTFCTLQPMRSVPFRVVALIGLNDGDFPRQSRSSGFDLMNRERRLCDPSRRDEDRYLFLEALLSVRDRLILTWQGHDPRDGSSRPPSVVVSDLLDALSASVAGDSASVHETLVVNHPLQPFSPASFLANHPAPGANPLWFEAVQASRERLPDVPPFCPAPLPVAEDVAIVIPLGDLERFWRQPAAYFLRHRLRLRLVEADEGVNEREPFTLAGLASYHLGQDLTTQLLTGSTVTAREAVAQASGVLPAGPMGEGAWRTLAAEAQGMALRLQPWLGSAQEPVPFAVELAGGQVIGSLAIPGAEGRLLWRFATLKARDRLRAWLYHLCACASGTPAPTLLVGRDEARRYAPLDVGPAREHLQALLSYYREGCSRPLPFFPESSLLYAQTLAKGQGHAAALAAAHKVWFSSDHVRGEDDDRHFQLCFAADPLDDEFAQLAQTLWTPLLAGEVEA